MREFYEGLARYTIKVLPHEGDLQLRDYASTAQQFGCMALVQLGVAIEKPYGCELLYAPDEAPRHIDPNAIWLADGAHVLLSLAGQFGDLSAAEPETKSVRNGMMTSTIKSAHEQPSEPSADVMVELKRLYPEYAKLFQDAQLSIEALRRRAAAMVTVEPLATNGRETRISPAILDLLIAIDWVDGQRWTDNSTIGLWRGGLMEGFEQTTEFTAAADTCIEKMPEDVRKRIDEINAGPADTAIKGEVERIRVSREQSSERRRIAQQHRNGGITTPRNDDIEELLTKIAIESLQRRLGWELDHVFFARWRMQLGWDSEKPLLPLFNDRLATAMRRAVVIALR